MVLNVHSDASYISAKKGRSCAGWCFFFGDITFDGTPIKLNGNILIICTILKFLVLVASAAEVKLGALFIKEKTLVVVFLREMTVS